MERPSHRRRLAIALGILALGLGPALPVQAGSTPVRCYAFITAALSGSNVPLECTRPDETTFYNVPPGHYLYVTDVLLRPRLTTQESVGAGVRIWKENFSSATGCAPTGETVEGEFVTSIAFRIADTSQQKQLKVSYQVPYLVATENDCLASYTSDPSGAVIEVSGLLSTSAQFGLIRLPEPPGALAAALPLLLFAAARRNSSKIRSSWWRRRESNPVSDRLNPLIP